MENPFESGHIKNYLLFYASVVVIMVLFFIATSLFNDVEQHKKKIFNTEVNESVLIERQKLMKEEQLKSPKFKLMESSY